MLTPGESASILHSNEDRTSTPRRTKLLLGLVPANIAASNGDNFMFWAIFVALLILWALGLICHITFSHLLLVIAVIILIIRLVRGRAP